MSRKPVIAATNGNSSAANDASGRFFVQLFHEERGLVSSQFLVGAAEVVEDPNSNIAFLNYRFVCSLNSVVKVEFYLSQYRFTDYSHDGESVADIDVTMIYGSQREKKNIKFANSFGVCKFYIDEYTISVEIVENPAEHANKILREYQKKIDEQARARPATQKRGYRRKDQLPDPQKDHRAEANRNDAKFQTRISQALSARVDAFLRVSGQTKAAFTEEALSRHLDALEPS